MKAPKYEQPGTAKTCMTFKKPALPLLVFCIGALIFLAVGAQRAFQVSFDFVPVYTGARCLLHGCNPYDTQELQQQFFQAGGRVDQQPFWNIDVPVYPPSTFLVLSPFALLSYPAARLLWFVLNGGLLITAAACIVALCPLEQRWLATGLASFVLATSGILLVLGQPATLAISLLIIATYFFLQGRSLPLATGLLFISLAVKPQIGGLVVVYLVLARLRARYAAVALAGAFAVLVAASLLLSAHPASAHWLATLRANLASTLSPGGSADPRPANDEAVGDINLQTVTSIFFNETAAFNAAAYAIFAALLAALVLTLLRVRPSMRSSTRIHLPGIAAVTILTLTPVYHRFYDSRLLLLTIPATVIVFESRRWRGLLMAGLTVLAVVSIQYRVQAYLLTYGQWSSLLRHKLLFILLLRQQNLELLCLFGLCLVPLADLRTSRAHAAAAAVSADGSSENKIALPLKSYTAPNELLPR